MIIHSDVTQSDSGSEVDLDNICLICHDNLDEDSVTLKCGHKFNYKCIYMTYKALNGKRECPYCRGDGGYLELKKGTIPQMGIHKEFSDYVAGNFNLEDIEFIEGKCKHILKTGKNAGSQCTCKPKPGTNYCGRHIKYYE
jgi:hypothetical protein